MVNEAVASGVPDAVLVEKPGCLPVALGLLPFLLAHPLRLGRAGNDIRDPALSLERRGTLARGLLRRDRLLTAPRASSAQEGRPEGLPARSARSGLGAIHR